MECRETPESRQTFWWLRTCFIWINNTFGTVNATALRRWTNQLGIPSQCISQLMQFSSKRPLRIMHSKCGRMKSSESSAGERLNASSNKGIQRKPNRDLRKLLTGLATLQWYLLRNLRHTVVDYHHRHHVNFVDGSSPFTGFVVEVRRKLQVSHVKSPDGVYALSRCI